LPQVVERILFVFAKLNKGIGYVQGMNEVLVPIYYVMVFDKHRQNVGMRPDDNIFCDFKFWAGPSVTGSRRQKSNRDSRMHTNVRLHLDRERGG
jgi:hypothetical protein